MTERPVRAAKTAPKELADGTWEVSCDRCEKKLISATKPRKPIVMCTACHELVTKMKRAATALGFKLGI